MYKNQLNMKHSLLSLLCFFLFLTGAFAQNGYIKGKILDASTGEALIGASVVIQGTGTGSSTDLDGQYSFRVAPGTYNLVISYIGYSNQVVPGVQVQAGRSTVINRNLSPDEEVLETIVVEGEVVAPKGEIQVLNIKKKSPSFIDGVSGEFLRKTGDIDAAAAVSRVVGVNIEGGRYAYVRGLGDRYVQTTINGIQLPGLDPDRNGVQLDLIPARLLDNILIFKTFRPDLPGEFTGGLINISTSTFPEVLTVSASAAIGYNTNATFNDEFVDQVSSSSDWTGRDNGLRAIPGIIDPEDRDIIPRWDVHLFTTNDARRQELSDLMRGQTLSFNSDFDPVLDAPPPDYRFGFSVGNQIPIGDKGFQLGYQTSFSYNRQFIFRDDAFSRFLAATSDFETGILNQRVDQGEDQVLWGGLASIGAKLGKFNKLTFNFMYNQSGNQVSNRAGGTQPETTLFDYFRSNLVAYEQRALESYQLFGEHKFGDKKRFTFEWSGAFSRSFFDQPDIRTSGYVFRDAFFPSTPSSIYAGLNPSEVSALFFETLEFPPVFGQLTAESVPLTHYYRDLDQDNYNFKGDFTYEFNLRGNSKDKSSIKLGANYFKQDRVFREFSYTYFNFSSNVEGDFESIVGQVPTVLIDPSLGNIYDQGAMIQDAYEIRNNYEADKEIYAAYVMGDLWLSDRLRATVGVRFEQAQINFNLIGASFLPDGDPLSQLVDTTLLDDFDVLPSLSLTYKLNAKMNLRLAYNRTLARPSFRELAPYESFDFLTGGFVVGNPNLERALIDNFDLRFEVFPGANELYSISLFYKEFDQNIISVFGTAAGGVTSQNTWENADVSRVYGAELEIRKNLGFINPFFGKMNLYFNASYLRSVADVPDDLLSAQRNQLINEGVPESEINLTETRRMFQQPDYIFNTTLNYSDTKIDANLVFNVLGNAATFFPGIFGRFNPTALQQPAPRLNFNITYRVLENFSVRFSANNLINPYFSQNYDVAGEDDDELTALERFKLGRTFRLSLTYSFSKGL